MLDWFDHAQPGKYWSLLDISKRYNKIRIPALHISGWYDTYLKGSVDSFLTLCFSAGSDFARDHQYLIAGPWVHIPWGDRIGPANFGPEALLDTNTILLRWLDHWLKDSGSFAGEPRIRHFVLGENRWRQAAAFPVEANHALYLHSGGNANSRKGDGTLSQEKPASDEPCDIFVHDPEVPVMAPGGAGAASGPFDQSALEMGNNVLVYSTEPLADPLWIFGIPRIALHASTSVKNTDFTAKLVRVRPDGTADFISMGAARSSYLFRTSGYEANRIHTWNFSLDATSCRFDRGDRIRIEIASSAFPLFDKNPGSDVPPRDATSWDWRRSTQIVYHSKEFASALYLPAGETPL